MHAYCCNIAYLWRSLPIFSGETSCSTTRYNRSVVSHRRRHCLLRNPNTAALALAAVSPINSITDGSCEKSRQSCPSWPAAESASCGKTCASLGLVFGITHQMGMERRSISQMLDAPEGQLPARLPDQADHTIHAKTLIEFGLAGVRQPPAQHHRPPRHDASRQMNAAANFPANEFMAVGGAAYPIRESSYWPVHLQWQRLCQFMLHCQ